MPSSAPGAVEPDLGVGRPRRGASSTREHVGRSRRASGARGRSSSTTASSGRCCARSADAGTRDHGAAAGRERPPTSPPSAPDLVVLSPGPGDPSRMAPQIATVRALAPRAPWRAGRRSSASASATSCSALAAGAETRRLAVGHHGGNHAVLEAATGRVDIGAHNHEVEVRRRPGAGSGRLPRQPSRPERRDGRGARACERPDRIGPVPSGGRARTDRRGAHLRPGTRGARWRDACRARSSSSAPARSSSARRPSSTTPACRPAWRCASEGVETSWSTRTRQPS